MFRQNVITRFERALHQTQRDRPLGLDEICGVWLAENRRLYGEEVKMTPGYAWDWARIPHIFHSPFYCCNYVFGNLLSIILFQNCLDRGNRFLEEVVSLFSAGSSRSPRKILRDMGLAIDANSLWDTAFQYVEDLFDSLEHGKSSI
ncbi:MAG: hypothetical protein JRJ09_03510 [Deltaproteobacteria bacterium]|nr:hypothetical protein [Deltaproteobacteria bacterium]MBW2047580.1 hypothetical protein [Deltaproteobacteria bacterium]MBW2111652.1 hypothetical protein [Deltaproteobacteria bacterium]MBW2352224.1 hypothetical protein [Deltaproteobacteria bacterium]